ncbi:DUF4321 domain-containing protein [Paenibacillus beijingensis]|uniref:Membrane protein n=1 Tax=Paenibacillus beijingensis TaxID=1126833 RepID=A0A0D5NLA7_9BACL|nr:DUF4321 domain-containing protein [Paenibacillus beijingensis]AJY76056.1 membrane protein [Paenibacillus beijingensis]
MKKNGWILLLFIILGLVTGSLVSTWFKTVQGLSFLSKSIPLTWSPAADLHVVSYDLTFQVDLSLFSIAGLLLALWLYRKM